MCRLTLCPPPNGLRGDDDGSKIAVRGDGEAARVLRLDCSLLDVYYISSALGGVGAPLMICIFSWECCLLGLMCMFVLTLKYVAFGEAVTAEASIHDSVRFQSKRFGVERNWNKLLSFAGYNMHRNAMCCRSTLLLIGSLGRIVPE